MSRQVDPPERDAHPILHRAFRASRGVVTQWRVNHGMPITDPRYLDATEEDVLVDLLESMYVRGDAGLTAQERAIRAAQRDPAADAKVDAKIVESSQSGVLGKMLAAYARKAAPKRSEPRRVRIVAGRRP